MPRPAKGARLWLRPAREGHAAVWIIKDGGYQRSTGYGPAGIGEAESALAQYISQKRDPRAVTARSAPSQIPVADVITTYAREIAHTHARPAETQRRLSKLWDFFGSDTLGDVNGSRCRKYRAWRGRAQAARRELEDLRSAINHFFADELLAPKINIVLPDKAPRRERWLTRSEAAKLLWTAWRKSQPIPKAKHGEVRYVSRHIARFILVGLYTGTRASAICHASLSPQEGRGYVDLAHGVFYRRPEGEIETTKRKPPVALPPGLLAHIRRWKAMGANSVVEWLGEPVGRVSKGFRAVVVEAGLKSVSPHTLRHTAITWAMQDGVKIWAAAGYFGLSVEMLEKVYGHHHKDTHSEVTDAVRDRRAKRLERAARASATVSPPNTHEQKTNIPSKNPRGA